MGGRPLAPAPGRGALTALSSVMAGRDPATQPNAQHAWEDQPVRPGPADQRAQKERHSNAVAPDRFHRRARLHGRRQQAGVRDHRQRTSREGSLDAEPAPTPLTPPFRHPRARPGGPAMSLRPPAPASGVGLSQVTGPTIRAPTGDRATAPRTHLTTCTKPQPAPSPVYGGGGPRAAWRRGRPHAPLPAARHTPRLAERSLGIARTEQKRSDPAVSAPSLWGGPAKLPGRDPGRGGRPLAPPPGAARSPLSRPSWPDLIRPPSRTRSTRGKISRSGLVPRIKNPKRTPLRCCPTRRPSPSNAPSPSETDANKLVCEITVSGQPRTCSEDPHKHLHSVRQLHGHALRQQMPELMGTGLLSTQAPSTPRRPRQP